MNPASDHRRTETNVSLDAERVALLDLLLAEEGLAAAEPARIPRRSDQGAVPLTPSQARIWFLEQLEPGGNTYLLPTAVRLRAPIQARLLEQALHTLWRRHDSLRLTFRDEHGQIRQLPGHFEPPLVILSDLSNLPDPQRETALQHALDAELTKPFDLQRDRLLRARLIRLQPDDHVFVLTLHHIIADGWTINLLLRELVQIYAAALAGERPPLAEPALEFMDYAAWQQTWLEQDAAQRQRAYWQEQLRAPLTVTELPADFARPGVQRFAGRQTLLKLPASLQRDLHSLSRRAGTTLFMTLLAAFKLLLQRQTGCGEIVIGSPVSGRNRPELEGTAGLFVNSLVLRTDLSGDPSFLELLERVRAVCTAAFANQEVPFEQVIQDLQPVRDARRTPFFQIFFNMLSFDEPLPDLGVGAEFVQLSDPDAKFDLTLYLQELDGGIQLSLVYNRLLFSEARMAELLRQYEGLLRQATRAPKQRLSLFSLLTEEARAVLPDPAQPLSTAWEGFVFERLDTWAKERPSHPAVSDPDTRWSYADLARGSSRLANFLIARGVQPGDVVAIYAHRCAGLVCALMGVLKAGAVVCILDPRYPPARLQQYVETASPKGWLTVPDVDLPQTLHDALQAAAPDCRLRLPNDPDAVQALLATYSSQAPRVALRPDDIASLNFTSGSTGRPKGVAGRHRSLTHFYPWMAQTFHLSAGDRFSMLSGLGHDPLQRDIFTALWLGAEICVPDAEQMWQPGYLAAWMRDAGVTVTHLVPAMVPLLTAVSTDTTLQALRRALFVGEPLTRATSDRLQQLAPNATIVNLYGTSETQRAVSYHVVAPRAAAATGEAPEPKREIALGRGMPGAQLLVLTPQQTLAGLGELGELYVRSPHLAAGYWGDAEATAARFVQNPWGSDPLDRLYRTGDYGRFLPGGDVEFAGRMDDQANIRGFRVEMREIEHALLEIPTVGAAAVTTTRQQSADRLVAYVTPAAGQADLDVRQVQDHLRAHLPAPMVPTTVVVLDVLPLTPNGKIDWDALPPPAAATPRARHAAPRDPIEQLLADIWQDLLHHSDVGVYDDFFALGGHSILAIQMFGRLRDALGVELNPGLLFRHATIAELADRVRAQQEETAARAQQLAADNGVALVKPGRTDQPRFFCVHGAGGNVLFMQAWKPYFEQWAVYGLASPSVDGLSWPPPRVELMAAAYIQRLKSVQPQGPYVLGGYSGGGVLAYEMAQQLRTAGESVPLLVLIDTYHPSVGPRPYTWPTRLRRIVQQPTAVLSSVWQRYVAGPLLMWWLDNRYVKRGIRVPLEYREPVIVTHFVRAKQNYRPQPYAGDVLLVRSVDVGPMYDHIDERLGWGDLIDRLDVADVPGDHFTSVQEPHVRHLAQAILHKWQLLRWGER